MLWLYSLVNFTLCPPNAQHLTLLNSNILLVDNLVREGLKHILLSVKKKEYVNSKLYTYFNC